MRTGFLNQPCRKSRPSALWLALAVLFIFACSRAPSPQGTELEQSAQTVSIRQSTEEFAPAEEGHAQVDLLWVIDNSAGMDSAQQKLRKAFAPFARKYLRADWDVRMAVITTDAYLANPAFEGWLHQITPGTTGLIDTYLKKSLPHFKNPASQPTLVDLQTGELMLGLRPVDEVPAWGPAYARLLPGSHDGPVASLCYRRHPREFYASSGPHCSVRETLAKASFKFHGNESCLRPAAKESSLSQCVNTMENDTVHSGQPVLSTRASQADIADAGALNLSVGTAGSPSARGFGSLLQFWQDNESSETAFFRAGSHRIIVFVSQEDDQTMELPALGPVAGAPMPDAPTIDSPRGQPSDAPTVDLGVASPSPELAVPSPTLETATASPSPATDSPVAVASPAPLLITPASAIVLNPEQNGYLLDARGRFQPCTRKTPDGVAFKVSRCADPKLLTPLAMIKEKLDAFFAALDAKSANGIVASASGRSSYEIAAIVPISGQTIKALQGAKGNAGPAKGRQDYGGRYVDFANRVNGAKSNLLDLGEEDFSPAFDQLGVSLAQKFNSYILARAPLKGESLVIKVVSAQGASRTLPSSAYAMDSADADGRTVKMLDASSVGLQASDRVLITYRTNGAAVSLPRAPTAQEDLIVKLIHKDGRTDAVSGDAYRVDGNQVLFKSPDLSGKLSSDDRLTINFRPKSAF